jgi:3',5'-cyclic AMP phosphodiesterase CpdA
MPIHLPPVSRRRFLTRLLTAGAAVAVAPQLAAATRKTDPDSWALLSDIHLAADRTKVARNINMTDHFISVSREVLELPKRPAGVFITGDCAFNSGEKNDYALVAELLEPIRNDEMPVHLALGNHDHRDRFWEALQAEKAAERPLADKQASLVRTKRANWFVLDSLEATLSTPGLLGQEQLEWLAKTLDANPDMPAIILIHHNPGTVGSVSGLKDTEALYDVIRPRKQVKAYYYGHTHRWKVDLDSSGIHLINLPPVAYLFKEGDPFGWVHATMRNKGMQLELRCLDQKHKEHGRVVDLKWRSA